MKPVAFSCSGPARSYARSTRVAKRATCSILRVPGSAVPRCINNKARFGVICSTANGNGAYNGASEVTISPSLVDDARVAPLRLALEKAKTRLDETTKVREALEAEAQEVAQLAVDANESKDKAKNKVFVAVSEIEDITRQQNEYLERVEKLQEKLDAARENRSSSSYVKPQEVISMEVELEAAQNLVDELTDNLDSLRDTVKSLFENAVAAEASALRAEEVAAAAMKAAEGAVNDEMEAAAVVRETQLALEKTIDGLEAIKPGSRAVPAAAVASQSLDAAPGAEEAIAPAEVAEPVEDEVKVPRWLAMTAGVAFAAILFSWTPPGQAVVASLQPVIDSTIGSIHIDHSLHGLIEAICLMFAAVVCVPAVVKLIPGGNPVLGYLLAGALVGPYAFGIIHDVEHMRHTAELGVVFLLFNIGLELSIERLQSMAKFVFGMGTCQVLLSLAGVAVFAMGLAGLSAPAAIVLGGALAMSSTAVAIQVLEERGEMGSRFGRATFSVLLLQDLAVVVLLMLIPLLAPSDSGSSGLGAIMAALGTAAVKAVACIVGIIALGRKVVTPLYNWMANFSNAEIFAATTLVITLGTAVLTQVAGLSLALGAFLAGLLISETDYALQVESDIAPYKGLLMGLFFMTVGMEISVQLFAEKWKTILVSIVLLLAGKVGVMLAAGAAFGLPQMAALRAGLLLAPGGEFAFVAFGEAVSKGLLPVAFSKELYLTVALSMALIPYLAAAGGMLGQMFDKSDVKSLQPQEGENDELSGHVIIAGYGRIGQTLAQMLSQELVPFCALDAASDVVQKAKSQDLPVYFGDAGSPKVLHHMGAERAACIVIALDTPGSNYRAVWTVRKHFPHLKIYVRAFDVAHGKNLEKAGATAVVPETLEPSLQLASAIFSELDYPPDEVTNVVDRYRRAHIAELTELSMVHNTSLGYGYEKKSSGKGDRDSTRDMKSEVERALAPAPA